MCFWCIVSQHGSLTSALHPGRAYTANKDGYLQDSFRIDVSAPTMMGIDKELKANFIVEALLVVGLLVNIVVSIYLLIKTKYLMRRIRNK